MTFRNVGNTRKLSLNFPDKFRADLYTGASNVDTNPNIRNTIINGSGISLINNDNKPRWHHICYVTDATGGYIYTNGILQGFDETHANAFILFDDIDRAILGGNILANPDQFNVLFDGSIADFNVWNVAINARSIIELYKDRVHGYDIYYLSGQSNMKGVTFRNSFIESGRSSEYYENVKEYINFSDEIIISPDPVTRRTITHIEHEVIPILRPATVALNQMDTNLGYTTANIMLDKLSYGRKIL
jgi:hypothetical protein